MLIYFEAENFRSICNPVQLSLSAVNYYKENQECLLDNALPGLSGVKFLPVAAIYGPNASGKTSLFRAMQVMSALVVNRMKTLQPLAAYYNPFLLDAEHGSKPTRFLAAFTAEGIRYEYEFSYDAQHICSEALYAYPKGFKQIWFTRDINGIVGSNYIRIPKAILPLINDDVLLLSFLAFHPKVEGSSAIAPVFGWFENGIFLLDRGPESLNDFPYSGEILNGSFGTDFQRSFILDMVSHADIGIRSVRVEEEEMSDQDKEIRKRLASVFGEEDLDSTDGKMKRVVFAHDAGETTRDFLLGQESDGTAQLFGLSGHVAESLENGSTLFVDELDKSLHPTVVKEIIRCFGDRSINASGAQLIFTAHNPCLLEGGFLRRDQIWFTEKRQTGATELYSLSEYSPRQNESISAGYLAGRYSAAPIVPECFGLSTVPEGSNV